MNEEVIPNVVLFYDISHIITRQMINGVVNYANTNGPWFLTLSEYSQKPILPKPCHGIIACEPTVKQLHQLKRLKIPLVIIDTSRFKNETQKLISCIHHVRCETKDFGTKAAEFYLSQSIRTFGYIGTSNSPQWDIERGEAFVNRIREEGFSVLTYRPKKNEQPVSRSLVNWLKKCPKPISVFAANDERAQHVFQACQLAELSVPYDVKILGVDNDKWFCKSSHPNQSSIPFKSDECGTIAAKKLDALMENDRNKESPLPEISTIIPPGEVVSRESTAERVVSDPIVDKALSFIYLKKGLNIRATDVAEATGFALNRIEKHFRQVLNISLFDEISRARLKTILQLIKETNAPITKLARLCGFTDSSTLCRLIRSATGKTISELRENK